MLSSSVIRSVVLFGCMPTATVVNAQTLEIQRVPAHATACPDALAFLTPFGLDNFSDHYVEALSTLLCARDDYERGDTAAAKRRLARLWSRYPPGDASWAQLPRQPFGINTGSPTCYYALRMLTDIVDWRRANPGAGPPARTARLTVVLVGRSNGIEPRSTGELQQGTGLPVQHTLDPALLTDGSRIVRTSLELFTEYVLAATEGTLGVDVNIIHLPELDLEVEARISSGRRFAGLKDPAGVWPEIAAGEAAATDWWWVIYPSHVPEQYPDFQNAEFVTGGMGTRPDSRSPMFLIDDRWLVRKPPHIGTGPYTDVERETYLPQWLQHEFFHHLFRIYPAFGLEDASHQWFDRSTWPSDFQGWYEADYYHEALHRRLKSADEPLVAALRYSITGVDWQALTTDDLRAMYTRSPVTNGWHIGVIDAAGSLEWRNSAGVRWSLTPDLANGELLTGPDCPYFGTWGGNRFRLAPRRNEWGDPTPEVHGFYFNGELYELVWP